MGNSISKYTGGKGKHPVITEQDVANVAMALQNHINGQDEAKAALVTWLEGLQADTSNDMLGSICLAGARKEVLAECLDILCSEIFSNNRVQILDMQEYSHAGSSVPFLESLKNAHGNSIIVFQNIMFAHLKVTEIINQIIFRRTITTPNPQMLPNQIFWVDRLKFTKTLFVAVHDPPLFSSQPLSAKQIRTKTRNLLQKGANMFDDIVPFVTPATLPQIDSIGGSSSAREDMFRTPKSKKHPLLSSDVPTTPRQAPQEVEKPNKRHKKIHNSTITMNNNNSNYDSNNAKSYNSSAEDHSYSNSNKNTSTTNSYNTTSSLPLSVSNSNIMGSKSSEAEKETAVSPFVPPELVPSELANQPFPIRDKTFVEPFVDGEGYFSRLYDVLTQAKQEILICGWQLSQIYLKRPHTIFPESDLFRILDDAGKRQVAVYIMLRNSDQYVIKNKHSVYKQFLEGNENIHVSLQYRWGVPQSIFWALSHHQKFVVVDRKIGFVGGLDLALGRWDTQEHPIVDMEEQFFPDDDYYHCGDKEVERNLHPRMGWHDVQLSVEGEIVADLRDAFMQRWNPGNPNNKINHLPAQQNLSFRYDAIQCTAQIVRSISGSAIGEKRTYVEQNVMRAYCDLVRSAETYVYIENQYFLEQDSMELINTICERIFKAHKEKKPFIVAVLLPVVPDNGKIDGMSVKTILTQQRETISYLNAKLEAQNIMPVTYIRFYNLVNHAKLAAKFVQAQIYIHSKIMITDSKAIVGSGNINFRSTSGYRDTEIGVVVHSREFCKKLVKQLLAEHSGDRFVPDNIQDFIARDLDSVAAKNDHLYGVVFPAFKSKSTKEYKKATEFFVAEDPRNYLGGIRGHVIPMSMNFLEKDTRTSVLSPLNPMRSLSK